MTKEISIRCNKCGHKLPPGSVYCDKCGAAVPKNTKVEERIAKRGAGREFAKAISFCLAIVFIGVGILIGIASGSSGSNKTDFAEKRASFAEMKTRVTPEMYEQIEFGMTYDEAKALLGGEEGMDYYDYRNEYMWPGEYYDTTRDFYDNPSISLKFSDSGNLIEISESRVLDGKEIYEAKAANKQSVIVISEEKLAELKERMSYREFADILGAEGVLIDSESDKAGFSSKTYEWKYSMEGDTENSYKKSLLVHFYGDKAERNSWDIWGAE